MLLYTVFMGKVKIVAIICENNFAFKNLNSYTCMLATDSIFNTAS